MNSSSQHSSKYTDLLLFPLPSLLCLFRSLFSLLQLGAPLNISTPCCSTPKITLWKIKMLKCSSKIFTQYPPLPSPSPPSLLLQPPLHSFPHQSGGSGVEWSDLRGGVRGRQRAAAVTSERRRPRSNLTGNKSDLSISGRSVYLPSVSPPLDPLLTHTLSHTLTLPIDGLKSLQPSCDEE